MIRKSARGAIKCTSSEFFFTLLDFLAHCVILVQEKEYLEKRERERIQNIKEIESKSQEYDNPNLDLDSQRTIFFKSESKHNPEYRKESSRFREYLEEMDEKEKKSCVVQDDLRPKKQEYKPKRLFNDKGM